MSDIELGEQGRRRLFRRGMPPMWLAPCRERWTRRIAWHVLATASVATVGLLLFAKVGEDVIEHESGSFDAAVRTWMLAHRTPALFRLFTWVTNAGSSAPILAATALICLWLWRVRSRPAAAGPIAFPRGHATVSMAAAVRAGYLRWREHLLGGRVAATSSREGDS